MKNQAIKQMCTRVKTVEVVSLKSGEKWIGNGEAWYTAGALSALDTDGILQAFDITDDKRAKMNVEERHAFPQGMHEDTVEDEEPLQMSGFGIVMHGRHLMPLRTADGILYFDTDYMKPFSNKNGDVCLCERKDDVGNSYIVIKEGFVVKGIVRPYVDILTDHFVSALDALARHTRLALENL